ncbi:hypothetical protein SLS54_009556 [Diplodia seriata]
MKAPDKPSLAWQQALESLETNKDIRTHDAWPSFKEQHNSAKISDVISQLREIKDHVEGKHSKHGFARTVDRLELLHSVVGEALQFAPPPAGIVFTSLSVLFNCAKTDLKLCDTICDSIESVTRWMFVGEVYAKRHPIEAGQEMAETQPSHDETEDEPNENTKRAIYISNVDVQNKVSELFAFVLEFCFEITKLEIESGGTISKDSADRSLGKSLSSKWTRKAKSTFEEVRKGFKRKLWAFFGEEQKIKGLVANATRKLQELEQDTKIAFEAAAEEVLGKIAGNTAKIRSDIQKLKALAKSANEQMGEIRDGQKTLSKSVDRPYSQKLERLFSWAGVPVHQPIQECKDMEIYPGTCDWILEKSSYKDWANGQKKILWVSGKAGIGKSHVASFAIQQLQKAPEFPTDSHDAPNASSIVVFFYCHRANDATQNCRKIMLHLVAQLFNQCSSDNQSEAEAFEVVKHSMAIITETIEELESTTIRRSIPKGSDATETIDRLWMDRLKKTFLQLVKILDRRVFVVLDGLDACHWQSIKQLGYALESLATDGQDPIQLLVSSRSNMKSAGMTKAKASTIFMDEGLMKVPVTSFLDGKVRKMAHIPPTLCETAVEKATKCSNASFLRATKVVQILERAEARINPYEALDNLKHSVDKMDQQALQSLDDTYRKWLKIALRWIICGDGDISATLIADEIEQTYLRENPCPDRQTQPQALGQIDGSNPASENDKSCQDDAQDRESISELVEQTSDFLRIPGKDRIELARPTIRDWVEKESQQIQSQAKKSPGCENCWKNKCNGSPFEAAPKHGHLLLARHIMRTLNSEKFQKEHIIRCEPGENNLYGAKDSERSEEGSGLSTDAETDKSESIKIGHPANSDGKDDSPANDANESGFGHPRNPYSDSEESSAIGYLIRDDSDVETVVSSDDSASTDEHPQVSDSETKGESYRYELLNWHYHIRQAEQMWPEAERENGPYAEVWSELYSEVDKFMDNASPAFQEWQKRLWPDQPFEKFDSRLHYAAAYGLVGVMKRFIDAKDDPLETNEYGQIPLHLACLGWADYTGLDFILEKTVEKGNEVDLDPLNDQKNDQTPVMLLVRYGAPVEQVKRLVKKGSKLNLQRENDDSTLHDAVKSRSFEMCQYILNEHVLNQKPAKQHELTTIMETESSLGSPGQGNLLDPNIQNNAGETPLHILLKQDDASIQIADLLISKQAQICAEDFKSQQPLFNAAMSSNNAIADILLRRGAEVDDTEQEKGRTALHVAVSTENIELVRLLLNSRANPSAQDHIGQTPVLLAAEAGFHGILEALLETSRPYSAQVYGGEAQDPNDSQHNLLPENSVDHVRLRKMLLSIPDKQGNTPLHKAAGKGHSDCVHLLLQCGAEKSSTNDNGSSPLHSAVKRERTDCIRLLIESGYDINSQDKHGMTPLHYASKGDKEECIRILLAAGSNPNITDELKQASLHHAVKGRNHTCVQLLLEFGADPNVQDGDGLTPLHHASREKDFESMSLLCEREVNFSFNDGALQSVVKDWELESDDDDYFENRLVRLPSYDNYSQTILEPLLAKLISQGYFDNNHPFRILNRALERNSNAIIRSIASRMNAEQVDSHGWSLLALALKWGDHELLNHVPLLERSESPSAWHIPDDYPGLDVSPDGLEVCFPETCTCDLRSIRSDYPVKASQPRFYFEIEVLECPPEGAIGIGFCSQFFELSKFPGWSSQYRSWGYHSDDGSKFRYDRGFSLGFEFGETWKESDIVGAGVDFIERKISFTKNGVLIGPFLIGRLASFRSDLVDVEPQCI